MDHNPKHQKPNPYGNLALMAVLSFIAMYFLMYSMVDRADSVYMSFNQVYMASVMTAPMIVIELIVMRAMYHDARLSGIILVLSIVVGTVMFMFIRQQTAINDTQFLRSMIPHHSGAILMCREASINDPEITALCKNITSSQQREIDQMRAILNRLR